MVTKVPAKLTIHRHSFAFGSPEKVVGLRILCASRNFFSVATVKTQYSKLLLCCFTPVQCSSLKAKHLEKRSLCFNTCLPVQSIEMSMESPFICNCPITQMAWSRSKWLPMGVELELRRQMTYLSNRKRTILRVFSLTMYGNECVSTPSAKFYWCFWFWTQFSSSIHSFQFQDRVFISIGLPSLSYQLHY